jgi:hypothetical protein
MSLTVAYPGALYSQSMKYPCKPAEGFIALPLTLLFTPATGNTGITGYTVNLGSAGSVQQSQFSQLVTVFIDNSQSPGTTAISVVGTPQTIVARPFSRGYYPVNASNLNLVITNNSLINSTVEVVCLNYIVAPSIDQAAPSTLGDMDAVISDRIGNTTSTAQLTGAINGTIMLGGFAQSTGAFPYYYLTAFDVSWFSNDVGSGDEPTAVTYGELVDYDIGSGSVYNTFCSFLLFNQQPLIQLVNTKGVLLSGKGTLGFKAGLAIAGNIAINWYGGRSQSAITAAQFAVVT